MNSYSALKMVYFHSDEIGIDNILWGLLELGVDVENPPFQVFLQDWDEEMVETISSYIKEADAVITQDFSVAVAESCHRMNRVYISWIYDSPQRALYMKEAMYDTNYVFCFDKNQLSRMKKIGLKHAFYCPLAANIAKTALLQISDFDMQKYRADISFVGNLYNRAYMNSLTEIMPESTRQKLAAVVDSVCLKWEKGVYVFNRFDKELMHYCDQIIDQTDLDQYNMTLQYIYENLILIPLLAYKERMAVLEAAGEKQDVHLYTKDPEKINDLPMIHIHGPVNYEDEIFKVYYSSKINLNITMRGIETGIPQRVFDIMSVGGVVLSNYQEEAEELFEPDKEILLFHSIDEMKEKADYYLLHDRERMQIAINGYQKVKGCYNYRVLLSFILNQVFNG